MCAASTGSACCLRPLCLLPTSSKAPPGFPSQRTPALDSLGGRDVQGLVREERPRAGSRLALGYPRMGDPCHGDRQEDGAPSHPPTTSSDPFLDKLSRPRAQPVRTPRLGLEESQLGNPWGWLSSSLERPQHGGWGHRGNQGAAHNAAMPAQHRSALLDLGNQHKALGGEKI